MVGNHEWWPVARRFQQVVFPLICLLGLAMGFLVGSYAGISKAHSFPAFNQSELYRTGTYSTTNLDVKIASINTQEIRYQVTMPDGSSFDLKTAFDLPARHYPSFQTSDLKNEAEYYRATIQGFAQLIQAGPAFDFAAIGGAGRALYTLEINQDRLREKGFLQFDPLQLLFRQLSAQPASGNYSTPQRVTIDRVAFELPSTSSTPQNMEWVEEAMLSPAKSSPKAMLKKTLQFLLDAMVISTKRAWNTHKSGEYEIRRNWDERGVQFGIKLEFMVGIGRLNVARSVSLNISAGYNRQSKSLVFRRGFRMEKMADGSNLSIGGKVEIKQYRLNTSSAYGQGGSASDHAKVSGQAWYPPMFIPVVSPVFETGRGYQSEGFSLAGNIADFGGSFLLNSVNAFEEAQRVYQAPLPDPNRWISDIMKRGEGFFVNHIGAMMPATHNYMILTSVGTRCELAFSRVH